MANKKRCMGCAERNMIIEDIHWMARRYADNRKTYAVAMVNDVVKWMLQNKLKVNNSDNIIWARDGMGRLYDGLSPSQATEGTPEARGDK